jgi:putative oxidoreductase
MSIGSRRYEQVTMSSDLALLILRLVVGFTLAGHGAQKLFGWWGGSGMNGWAQVVEKLRIRPARPWAWVAALSEFGGGLLLALGLLSPLGSLAITGAMLVAIATVHWPKGFWVTRGGYEFNLTLIASAAAVAIAGPGAYSIDRVFGINLPEPLTLLVGTVALVAGVLITLGTRAPQQAAQINRETA